MLICHYCNRGCKNNNSKAQHELYCKLNPNKKLKVPSYGMLGKIGSNQFLNAKKLGLEKPIVSVTTKEKLRNAAKSKIWDDRARLKHSIAMKNAVEKNPESYTSSNRGRTKEIIYDGMKFQGNWELDFYKWCQSKNILCIRNIQGFEYIWNGKRTYYPDFYIPSLDLYVEVKGYETERDKSKWSCFPNKLYVIKKTEIIAIRKGHFGGL